MSKNEATLDLKPANGSNFVQIILKCGVNIQFVNYAFTLF